MTESPDSLREPPAKSAPEWHKCSVREMRAALDRNDVSCRVLVETHLERIAEVDRDLRAFTEVFHDTAMQNAARVDEERLAGKERGPLHGIPVTLQEGFDFEGRPTTFGTATRRTARAHSDSALVRALSDAGAVILGRTNLGQLLLTLESDNPLFGRTQNPFSPRHSAGGPSGGEAAAVAAGLSPLGFGADVFGASGVPAHFCGVAQLKPTRLRLPGAPAGGLERYSALGVQSSVVARKVSDIGLALDALPARRLSLLDPRMPPLDDLPARSLVGLSVGVFSEGPLLAPSSALVGAIERAGDALRRAGAKLTPYTPPGLDELFFDCMSLLAADGGAAWLEALEGSPVAEALRPLTRLLKVPGALRGGMERVTRLAGDADGARFVSCFAEKSAREYQELVARLEARHVELCRALEAAEIDALLCPPFATPAVPHGQSGEFWLASGYSVPFSAMGWPFAVVPVTRVHGAEARRDRARGRLGRLARRIDEESAGLPVGVELVAPPWRDRTLVAMAQAIEHNVSGDVDFPRTPLW